MNVRSDDFEAHNCFCHGYDDKEKYRASKPLIKCTGVLLSFDRIQLQHKFWQPNVQQDSITAQFNYNSIQLQQNSITFLSITTNQTGPKSLFGRIWFW